MSADSPAGTVDPIYDAPYLVFVYAGWAGASWTLGDTAGLAVLVLGAAVLALAGLGQSAPFQPHSFAADLATILLFCSAAIGAGWFVVRGLGTMPLVTTLAVLASIAVAAVFTPAPDNAT